MKPTPTPETDAAYKVAFRQGNFAPLQRRCAKMERQRDEARLALLQDRALRLVECGWCGEIMHAPPGFSPPMTREKLKQTVRIHLLDCPKHPIRETERELAEVRAERDNWLAEAERWRKNADLYATVKGQRDRLAEVLRLYSTGYTDAELEQLAKRKTGMGEISPGFARREIKRRAALAGNSQADPSR